MVECVKNNDSSEGVINPGREEDSIADVMDGVPMILDEGRVTEF